MLYTPKRSPLLNVAANFVVKNDKMVENRVSKIDISRPKDGLAIIEDGDELIAALSLAEGMIDRC